MLTFLLPIALITLFALIFGGTQVSKSRAQRLVIVDLDLTDESSRIIAALDSLHEFEIRLTTFDTAQRWVLKGDEPSALILHKGLQDSLAHGLKAPVELQYDASKEAELGILKSALIGNLMRIIGARSFETNAILQFDQQNPGLDSTTRNGIHRQIRDNFTASQGGGTKQEAIIKSTPLLAQKENSPGLIHAVAGTAIMMLLFSVSGIGASILDERQEGTLKRLLYSPIKRNDILFGKVLATLAVSILQLTVMFLYAWIVFGLKITQNIPSLMIMILCTAFACSSFGVFLASFAKSRGQVQGLSTLIVLTMSAIGGSMVPTFAMPAFMQRLSAFSVNYWAVQGFYDIFWRNLPTSDVGFLKKAAVLLVIGVILNVIAVRMFKRNVLDIA